MFKTFNKNMEVKITCTTNAILYFLKTLPFLRKHMSDNLYANGTLKGVAYVIGILVTLVKTVIGKPIYFTILTLISLGLSSSFDMSASLVFVNLFFFLSAFGAWLNTSLCDVDMMKYISIYHLRMDAKKVVISEYIYYLAITFILFTPCLIVVMFVLGVKLYWALILSIYVILVKIVAVKLKIYLAIKFNRIEDDNFNLKELLLASIFIIPAFLLPILGISIGYIGVLISVIVLILPTFFCARSLWKYQNYTKFYKKLFTYSPVLKVKNDKTDLMKTRSNKTIDINARIEAKNKNGYKYFHYLFVQRHRKLLMKASKTMAVIELIILALLIAVIFIYPESKQVINSGVTNVAPFFMYIFLFTNRGTAITQSMFVNCDSSMLNYRFYRQPKVILALFKERLKTNIYVDCINSSVIAIALPLILFLTGGTSNPIEYFMLFITIIAISVFFSVHHLVMYYLLQPYNSKIEMKNPIYTVVTFILYFVCFSIYTMNIEIMLFGTIFTVFSVIYIIAGLILAYKLAPKTFRLK